MDPSAQKLPTNRPLAARTRLLARAVLVAGALLAAAVIAGGVRPAAAAVPATIWVDGGSQAGPCSDQAASPTQASWTRPLCSLGRAAQLARPGDTVMVRAGTYRETLAPRRSGTSAAPIRFTAVDGGVVIDADGLTAGLNVQGVHDLRFAGITVTGASRQGVWVSNAARISLVGVTIRDNQGPAVQLKQVSDVRIDRAVIRANAGAGIMELGDVRRGRYLATTIEANGHDGQPYNGDGIILNGSDAIVRGNTVTGNGDHWLYEHGVYASKAASGYLIEGNTFSGNSATGVKAQGAGSVHANRFGSSRFGIWVDASSGTGAAISGNWFTGTFVRTVATGAGARVKVWGNKLGGGVL
jgi:Right handed beta helix region